MLRKGKKGERKKGGRSGWREERNKKGSHFFKNMLTAGCFMGVLIENATCEKHPIIITHVSLTHFKYERKKLKSTIFIGLTESKYFCCFKRRRSGNVCHGKSSQENIFGGTLKENGKSG